MTEPMAEPPEPLAQRLLADVDTLVDLMADRVNQQVPSVQASPEVAAQMTSWLHRLLSAALELVIQDEPFDSLGPKIEQMARRGRAQGFDRWQTLRAYEVAQQTLLDALSRRLRGHPQEAYLFPQVTRRLLEFQRISTFWVTAGYSSGEPRSRDRDADIQALLEISAGRRPAAGDDHDLARRLGLSLPLREVTVSGELGAGLEDTVRNTSRVNPWSVVGSLDGRVVALTLRSPNGFPEPNGTAALPDDAPVPAVAGAVGAAGRAADVAAALGVGRLSAAEAAPLSAMLNVPEREREAYVEGCFRTLPQTPRGRSLLTAVSATLTYGRTGEAARALHVHRHTLDYRLGRFAEETGLDLGDPATRFRCAIGLFLIGLMPHRAEPAGRDQP
jgi:hypothetical protein